MSAATTPLDREGDDLSMFWRGQQAWRRLSDEVDAATLVSQACDPRPNGIC